MYVYICYTLSLADRAVGDGADARAHRGVGVLLPQSAADNSDNINKK